MKAIFLTEYFYPHAHGGSEWSIYYLAQSLIKKGLKIFIITPNFGTKAQEVWEKIIIHRLPFPIKISKDRPRAVTPFWFTNFIYQLYSIFWIIRLLSKIKFDLLHIQGNYFLPAGVIAGKLFKKPIITTVRDYQVLCPYGFCLIKNRDYKRCNIDEYFKNDVKVYLKNYHNNLNIYNKILSYLFSFRAKMLTYYYSFFLKKVDKIICISKKQQEIFNKNGFTNTTVIYNSIYFDKVKDNKTENYIFYAGRLTPGKGIELLIRSCLKILKNEKKLNLVIAGAGFLENKLRKIINNNNLSEQVKFLGQISYKLTLNYLKKAKISVIPSIWEEPFGRIALESLFLGVPTVVTDRGGLPEIVENKITGFIVKPSISELQQGILLALKNNTRLRKNILKSSSKFTQKFQRDVTMSYLKLYNLL